MKPLLVLIALFIGILGVWLVYWPIMESIYAMSWVPLTEKICSFFVGIMIIIVDSYIGIKVLF